MHTIVNPKLLELVQNAADIGAEPDMLKAIVQQSKDYSDAYASAIRMLSTNHDVTMAGPVYRIPMLTRESCDEIVAKCRELSFERNEIEGERYQIDESVLQTKCPELYDRLGRALLPVLNMWSLLIYQRPITRVASFQIAKYTPEGTYMTGFHHDRDSDVTAVISLNPGEFEGGGTDLRIMPHESQHVPPLNKGTALFFNGKMIHHRGSPVTKGERYLLVCWLESEI